jgi:tRNA threonylcarbamoyladenosine biosynthesis protein TsaE
LTFEVEENGDLTEVANAIIKLSKSKPIILFKGDLGAGKTTLIKVIGTMLGIGNQMNSPSFGLVNIYDSEDNKTFYHLDLYRLKDPNESRELALIEMLNSGNVCWIEWPEILTEVWQHYDVAWVKITTDKHRSRSIFVDE